MHPSLGKLQVVILCGGKGTRIRGVDDSLPKPMIPVGKHPILVHIMEHYARFGYHNIILCLGHLGDVIRTHFGVRDNANITQVPFTLPSGNVVQLTLAETGEDSMTGSRVWQIRDLVGTDDFLLTYGDGLSDVPIQQLVEFHNSHSATMTLTAVRPPSRFGEVEVGTDGLATSFNEKPQVSAGLISGGFFVCRPTIFDYLSPREDLVLEAEPMRRMTSDRRLAAYVHEGFWQCMDTYRDWLLLNELEATGKAPWRH
jgi:glucose-1-phosphate cytidylyltransferase